MNNSRNGGSICQEAYYASNKSLLLSLILRKKLYVGLKLYVWNMSLPPVQNLEKFITPNNDLTY